MGSAVKSSGGISKVNVFRSCCSRDEKWIFRLSDRSQQELGLSEMKVSYDLKYVPENELEISIVRRWDEGRTRRKMERRGGGE